MIYPKVSMVLSFNLLKIELCNHSNFDPSSFLFSVVAFSLCLICEISILELMFWMIRSIWYEKLFSWFFITLPIVFNLLIWHDEVYYIYFCSWMWKGLSFSSIMCTVEMFCCPQQGNSTHSEYSHKLMKQTWIDQCLRNSE